MMKKIYVVIFLIIFFGICMMGCERGEKNKRTSIAILHGYGSDTVRDTKMREIYKEFELKNPDISINLISVPGFELVESRTRDLLAVGKMPNIIYTGGYSMDSLYHFMIEEDYLLNLEPYIREDEGFAQCISSKMLEEWGGEGGIYTLTDNMSLRGYWYNKKIFENAGIKEVPRTRQAFIEACENINDWAARERLNTVPLAMDAEGAIDLVQYFGEESSGTREKASNTGNKAFLSADRELFRLALEKLREIYCLNREGKTYSKKDSLASFNVGHSAIYFGELWEGGILHPNLDAEFAFFPDEGSLLPMYSALSGYLVSNMDDEGHKEASVRFVKYMLGEDVQRKLLDVGMIPANPKVEIGFHQRSQERIYAGYEAFLRTEDYILAPQKTWNAMEYTVFMDEIPSYLSGKLTEEELMGYMGKQEGQ